MKFKGNSLSEIPGNCPKDLAQLINRAFKPRRGGDDPIYWQIGLGGTAIASARTLLQDGCERLAAKYHLQYSQVVQAVKTGYRGISWLSGKTRIGETDLWNELAKYCNCSPNPTPRVQKEAA